MPVETGPQNPFKYILVAGPDKLGIAGFVGLMRRKYVGTRIGDMHNLMSENSCRSYFDGFKNMHENGVLSYYARRVLDHPEPMKVIPECLRDIDLILWFELYASVPVVLRTTDSVASDRIVDMWKGFAKV